MEAPSGEEHVDVDDLMDLRQLFVGLRPHIHTDKLVCVVYIVRKIVFQVLSNGFRFEGR